jgi:MYXO-CTERM domain-containing protein
MMARWKHRSCSFLSTIAFSFTFASPDAHANGRLPKAHQLVFSATDPGFVAIEATFGLFLSGDRGADFGWVCEQAIGYPATLNWDPPIGITSTSVLAGTPHGVSVSADRGCSWQVTLTGQVVDIVVRRDDAHSALALVSSYSGRTDAGESAYSTQVFATHDDGATWSPQGMAIEPDVLVETIDIAPGDPNTTYVGGARTLLDADGSVHRTGIVLASTNGGASYTATEIPLELPLEVESSAFVSAVHPNDPQRVYVRVSQSTDSAATSNVGRLLVSDDGAATFRTVYQAQGALPGFALSSDGSRVFVGDSVAGVLLAAAPPVDSGAPYSFAQRSAAIVDCLTWSAGNLYACTPQAQNPYLKELAVSKDDGLSFSPVFRFGCVSGPLACDAGAVTSTCSTEFPSVQALVGACSDDGGSAEASAPDSSVSDQDAGAETSRPRASSCGCEAGEAPGEVGGLSAIGLLVATVLRRRRARCTRARASA